MEIKYPFSWTTCSCAPSEVKGDRRGPGVGGHRATLQTSLRLEIRPWLLSPPPLSPAQEEALLGPLWPVLSHQRGLRAVVGPEPAQLEVSSRFLQPVRSSGCSQLPPTCTQPSKHNCDAAPPRMSAPQLLPFPRGCSQEAGHQLWLVSGGAGNPTLGLPPLPAAANFPLVLAVFF